ncbi:hypothetical protein ABE61_01915 [Lysinibacillus sphaericus]|uniref:DUF262 domain-containing protein n=1 Tax=Lysinibacillus sphaericus TaxID=1421 RepID=UPI0018CCC860|nr:DUF262 domain-containing protein [Lysinibacillus sphaericus]MBG9452873.1 hypothetical protein [Lysinibacillus sphaericus]MBG9480080.1 hypothetical protein [Lysinibacillus sphaericus]MBG9593728.1 hypothetical protein [Lysinibacillus sphaericus]
MALLQDELKITKVKGLFEMKLALPSYQRPYSWSVRSTSTLFLDTYNAYQEGTQEYRIGSVILHKENEKYNVVDGQQRLTTLSILLYCLGYEAQGLLREKYNQLSNDVIVTNFKILSQRISELTEDERSKYKEYLLEQCSAVQIVTDSEQEAFQFFDSQNSRGKELAPHDLLKSYHLREMDDKDEHQKVRVINQWENVNQNDLNDLFKSYLYPLTQWYKGKNGLGYSSSKIDVFKGIKTTNVFNYAIYHKASNLFVEQFNENGSSELLASRALNQFQLTQPLMAGNRFFNYALHYGKQLEQIRKKINKFHTDEQTPSRRSGDIYIKQLYECVLLFFADRFGFENLTNGVMQQLYTWSYSLRLTMYAVYPQTIDKYARGGHERVNKGLDMFAEISEMNSAEELKLIVLEQPDFDNKNKEKYKAVYDLLCDWNRW